MNLFGEVWVGLHTMLANIKAIDLFGDHDAQRVFTTVGA